MKRIYGSVAVLACFAVVISVEASKKRKAHTSPDAKFDYYVLALSWAPNYCAGHPGDQSNECRPGEEANFVLHGLWPQASDGDRDSSSGEGGQRDSTGQHRPILRQRTDHRSTEQGYR